MINQPAVVVGIDVAKRSLAVAVSNGESYALSNDAAGIAQLIQRRLPLAPRLVVIEASGNYEQAAWLGLWAAGLPVARVNPHATHYFAKARGQRAKSDPLDAAGLVKFGLALEPTPIPPPNKQARELQDLVGRRRQLITMLTAEQNRHQQAPAGLIRRDIATTIAALKRHKAAIEKALGEKLKKSSPELLTLLQSAPGVGPAVSAVLVTRLPELGTLGSKQAAALVGVAPFVQTSGKWRGQSHVSGGRADVRCALYMAAHNAVLRPGRLQDFYRRLTAAGKSHRQALTACMRKLIVILNVMVKHQTPWNATCPQLA
jgi:transposase